jgi:hypothetical protein
MFINQKFNSNKDLAVMYETNVEEEILINYIIIFYLVIAKIYLYWSYK